MLTSATNVPGSTLPVLPALEGTGEMPLTADAAEGVGSAVGTEYEAILSKQNYIALVA
jgi:hypothetical protein